MVEDFDFDPFYDGGNSNGDVSGGAKFVGTNGTPTLVRCNVNSASAQFTAIAAISLAPAT
jgi:hypothetical protein